ncbi:uncharacterized protein isoform X2 [Danio rerio]
MGDEAVGPLPSPVPSPSYPNPGRPRFSFSRSATATNSARTVSPAVNVTSKVFQRTIFLGQLEGEKIVQEKALIIPFEETEACLSAMKLKVKEALAMGEDENIVLTDSQGNVLLDTPGIRGSSYWKQSSRRIFAMTEQVFVEMGKRKRRKLGQTSRHDDSGLCDIKDKIEELLLASEGLPAVSARLRELCKCSEGLTERQSDVLRTSFKCCVCRGVMDSPVLSRCCRSLIGCRQCIEAIVDEGQACIKCRSAVSRDSIVVVAGLSEVLSVIKALDEQYNSR